MDIIDNLKTIKEAILTYGTESQKVVAMEEMSELIKEITKDLRGEPHKTNISEEMADVIIMMVQLLVIYNNIDHVKWFIDYKCDRLKRRINDETNKNKV